MSKSMVRTALFITLNLMVLAAFPAPGWALLPAHDCSFCHDLHGAAGTSLLSYTDTEVLCLSCHATAIGATSGAAVHNPNGVASNQLGYITCRECHDPHDNVVNSQGSANIKLVGIKFDPSTGLTFPTARIREELPAGYGPYRPVVFTNPSQFYIDGTYPGTGACEICHGNNNPTPDHARGFLP